MSDQPTNTPQGKDELAAVLTELAEKMPNMGLNELRIALHKMRHVGRELHSMQMAQLRAAGPPAG